MTLTRHDRCDAPKCGVAAYVRTHHGGLDLLWCSHHYNHLADALFDAGALVVDDERHRLTEGVELAKTDGVS